MKSKNLRILIIAICGIVIVTEAILFGLIFGKKSAAPAKEDSVQEEKDKVYIVKRVVQWTTPDTTATYQYDEYGRITEIVKEGRLRDYYPVFSSDFGIRIERFLYNNEGKLMKASYNNNDTEWEDDEDACAKKVLKVDSHGGVYYYNRSPLTAVEYTVPVTNIDSIYLNDLNSEKYDAEGRLIKKEYGSGLVAGRHSNFTYDGSTIIREDYDGDGKMIRICRFEYDYWGRLVLAKTTKNDRDTDAYSYVYDVHGNLICEDHWGTEAPGNYQIRYSYDEKGNLLKLVKYDKSEGTIWEETREYELVIMEEEYLTDEERKSFGLSYDPDMIEEKKTQINIESWNIKDEYHFIA